MLKMHLLQSIESFPSCGEIYVILMPTKTKVIIDHYVRQVSGLVISKRISEPTVSALYKKLISQILATESPGLAR